MIARQGKATGSRTTRKGGKRDPPRSSISVHVIVREKWGIFMAFLGEKTKNHGELHFFAVKIYK